MTTVVLAIRARGNNRRVVLVAVALLLVVFATTLAINLPINADQSSWSVLNPPADWAGVRDRWQVAHLIRTLAAMAAFGSLIAAALTRPNQIVGDGVRRTPLETSGGVGHRQ